MAKKITAPAENGNLTRASQYPWLRLLDLDIQRVERTERSAPRGKGRPRNPFPRQAVHITLTKDELAALDLAVEKLSQGMKNGIHRGNLVAFMAYRLLDSLEVPRAAGSLASVDSFTGLDALLKQAAENTPARHDEGGAE
jgi:hypothetical protein